jgi:hypothetical protein
MKTDLLDIHYNTTVFKGRILFRIPFTLYFLVIVEIENKRYIAFAKKFFLPETARYHWKMV